MPVAGDAERLAAMSVTGFTGQCQYTIRPAMLGWRWKLYAAQAEGSKILVGSMIAAGWAPTKEWARDRALTACREREQWRLRPDRSGRGRSTRSPRA